MDGAQTLDPVTHLCMWGTSYLFITEFLPEGGEQVAQLSRRDEAVTVLVKVAQTFDEVIGRVTTAGLGNGLWNNQYEHTIHAAYLSNSSLGHCTYLIDGQEHFEGYPLIRFEMQRALLHI